MDKLGLICVITVILLLGLTLGWILTHDEGFTARHATPEEKSDREKTVANWFRLNPKGVFSQFKKDTNGDIIEFEAGNSAFASDSGQATTKNLSKML